MSVDGGANNVPRVRAFAGQTLRKRIRYAVPGRLWSAWRALRGAHLPCEAVLAKRGPGPMATAVALATECAAPNGGQADVINDLLKAIPRDQIPATAAAAAVLAATFAREWAAYESTGPAELLQQIGLAAHERRS